MAQSLNRAIQEFDVSPSVGRYVSVTMPSMSWSPLTDAPACLAKASSSPETVIGSDPTFDTTMVGLKPSLSDVSLNRAVYAGIVKSTTTSGFARAIAETCAATSVLPGW